SLAPMTRAELAGDRLDLDPGCGFGAFEPGSGKPPLRKEPLCHADAADLEGFEALGLESAADDEFGRPAADVDDQAWLERAQRLAPGVEPVDLIAFDATDFEPEAVRAQVDDGERGGRGGHERLRQAWPA